MPPFGVKSIVPPVLHVSSVVVELVVKAAAGSVKDTVEVVVQLFPSVTVTV